MSGKNKPEASKNFIQDRKGKVTTEEEYTCTKDSQCGCILLTEIKKKNSTPHFMQETTNAGIWVLENVIHCVALNKKYNEHVAQKFFASKENRKKFAKAYINKDATLWEQVYCQSKVNGF